MLISVYLGKRKRKRNLWLNQLLLRNYKDKSGSYWMQRQDNENRGVAQMLKGPKALFTQGLFAFFMDTNKKHMP